MSHVPESRVASLIPKLSTIDYILQAMKSLMGAGARWDDSIEDKSILAIGSLKEEEGGEKEGGEKERGEKERGEEKGEKRKEGKVDHGVIPAHWEGYVVYL